MINTFNYDENLPISILLWYIYRGVQKLIVMFSYVRHFLLL